MAIFWSLQGIMPTIGLMWGFEWPHIELFYSSNFIVHLIKFIKMIKLSQSGQKQRQTASPLVVEFIVHIKKLCPGKKREIVN